MKFINTLEENGGAGGRGGVEKVSLGSWLNPGQSRRGHRVRGVRVGAPGPVQAGGKDAGMEAQTGPVNEELRPPAGPGAWHTCVLWRGSFEFSFPEF